MRRKRSNILLLNIFTTFFLLWGSLVMAPHPAMADARSGFVSTDGTCELNDKNKKIIAQKGRTAASEVRKALNSINNSIENDYKADRGKCHFLKEKFWSSVAKWWDEVFRAGLDFDDHIVHGAENADKILGGTQGLTDVKWANDHDDYTDWDTVDLEGRVLAAKTELKDVSNFIKNATGSSPDYQVDKMDSRTAMNHAMGYNCSFIKVHTWDPNGYEDKCAKDAFTTVGELVGCSGFLKTTDANKCEKYRSCVDLGWKTGDLDLKISCYNTQAIGGGHSFNGDTYGRKKFLAKLAGNDAEKCIGVLTEMNKQRKKFIEQRVIVNNTFGLLSGELQANCKCKVDEQGRQTDEIDECEVLNPDFEENNIEVCPTVEEYRATFSKVCVTCGLFAKILAAAQNIADGTFNALRGPLSKLLSIGFLIFVAYTTLILVATPEAQKTGKYLTTLLSQGFKVAVTMLLLSSPKFLYDTMAEPLLDGSVDFGIALVQSEKQDFLNKGKEYESNFKSDSYISSNIMTTLVGAMAGFNESAATVPAIGASLWCNAWSRLGLSRGFFIPRVTMAIEGVFLLAFGFMIMFALGFYLLDAGIQLGIVCGIMPFLVACWPFKMTSKYTQVGWNMFLNTCFQFIMMGVVVTVIVELVSMSLSGDKPAEELIQILSSGLPDDIMEHIEFGGIQMVMCIVCCMFALKLAKNTGSLANKFAKGSPTNGMGTQVGAMAASAAKSAVKTTAKVGLAYADAATSQGGSGLGGDGGGGGGGGMPGGGMPGGGGPGGGGMPGGGMPGGGGPGGGGPGGGGPGGGGMPGGGGPGGGGGGMPGGPDMKGTLDKIADGPANGAVKGLEGAVDKADQLGDQAIEGSFKN